MALLLVRWHRLVPQAHLEMGLRPWKVRLYCITPLPFPDQRILEQLSMPKMESSRRCSRVSWACLVSQVLVLCSEQCNLAFEGRNGCIFCVQLHAPPQTSVKILPPSFQGIGAPDAASARAATTCLCRTVRKVGIVFSQPCQKHNMETVLRGIHTWRHQQASHGDSC